ncbi:MAG: hypothetical protein ACR2L6_02980 [Gemmatimonadaceae bacterium]
MTVHEGDTLIVVVSAEDSGGEPVTGLEFYMGTAARYWSVLAEPEGNRSYRTPRDVAFAARAPGEIKIFAIAPHERPERVRRSRTITVTVTPP